MRPHCSQSSCENATPSSVTSPSASYKEVPPPPSSVCSVESIVSLYMIHLTKLIKHCYNTVNGAQTQSDATKGTVLGPVQTPNFP